MAATSPSRRAALKAAALGAYVFPLCGKVPPAGMPWADVSTKDRAEVAALWKQYPEADGYGIDAGKSGLAVVDQDTKSGDDGPGNWARLAAGTASATFQVRTPSGGVHAYYRDPQGLHRNSAGKLAPGVDVRGVGGYVVGPGSPGYSWDGEAPSSLEEVPEAPHAVLKPKADPPGDDDPLASPGTDPRAGATPPPPWRRSWPNCGPWPRTRAATTA